MLAKEYNSFEFITPEDELKYEIINKTVNLKENTCQKQKYMILLILSYGGIGEVVNTVDCGSIIRGFDSHIPSQIVFY